MRVFEVRGDVPDDFEGADEICKQLIKVTYAHVRGEDGRFFLALDYDVNYLNRFGIEEVRDQNKLADIHNALNEIDED